MGGSHLPQCLHHHGTTGGAIGIEVGNNENAPVFSQRLLQQASGRRHAFQLVGRQQFAETQIQLFRTAQLALPINALQQWMELIRKLQIGNYRASLNSDAHNQRRAC